MEEACLFDELRTRYITSVFRASSPEEEAGLSNLSLFFHKVMSPYTPKQHRGHRLGAINAN